MDVPSAEFNVTKKWQYGILKGHVSLAQRTAEVLGAVYKELPILGLVFRAHN